MSFTHLSLGSCSMNLGGLGVSDVPDVSGFSAVPEANESRQSSADEVSAANDKIGQLIEKDPIR